MIKGKMKNGNGGPTVNYRKIDGLNQSMIKLFDKDPIKFYQQYKLGKPKCEKDSLSVKIGNLVDFFILTCNASEDEFYNRFDEKFVLFEEEVGTKQVFILAETLFELTLADTDEEGKCTTSFQSRFERAMSLVQKDGKYKNKTIDKVLLDFNDNRGKEYFDKLIDNKNKTVVDNFAISKSLSIGKSAVNDSFLSHIFQDPNKEIHPHLVIEWKMHISNNQFIRCKSEIDMLVIDHAKKTISPIDLKTNYDNESFDYQYLKMQYYLQLAFYTKAVEYFVKADDDLSSYSIEPFQFISLDTSMNNRRPIVYTTNSTDLDKAVGGFYNNGKYYRGLSEIVDEIVWCETNDTWNCSKRVYDGNGVVPLIINYT